jgi:hypothetical protein
VPNYRLNVYFGLKANVPEFAISKSDFGKDTGLANGTTRPAFSVFPNVYDMIRMKVDRMA